MSAQPIQDEGQTIPPPRGKLLGAVKTRQEFDRVAAALKEAGFERVSYLEGEDGARILERSEGFFFSDAEERVLNRHIPLLKAGGYVFSVESPSSRVQEAARIAAAQGAGSIVHFGYTTVTLM